MSGDGLTDEPDTGPPPTSTTVFTDATDGTALEVGIALAPGLGLTDPVGVDVGLTDGDGDVGVGLGVGLTDGDVGVGLGIGDVCGDGGQVEDGAGLALRGSGAGGRPVLSCGGVSGASGQPVFFSSRGVPAPASPLVP